MCTSELSEEGLLGGESSDAEGDDAECNTKCLGHENEYCGGDDEDGVPRVRFWFDP